MGFSAPSKIQETALPTLLADPPQNMIAQSQSGTGKTAAFVLAMLSRVDRTKNHPQVWLLFFKYEKGVLYLNTKPSLNGRAPQISGMIRKVIYR